ncbi:type III pantothenate kinase [Xanthomonas graminis]|uniref:Type III pantothenate kinase n=1 Tax=Xanthomonas graminis pv. graminis TaxID=134874 RepID=A0A1M4JDB7_9XANT|nr:type III pantothenate kinase [Xanthomonas translucens]OAX60542.1 pantothenate kinase [Xanthomonas translucens pv. graminis]UKE54595.1 type III pantothenate kinase [Xanthomonas translucens pv. graminis]WIH08669.1 type III pantothenate kinase [Xanthomonas translucens pv. graminis]WIH11955.1 type III pantothenate kinase [Xanthomonas translucens pv. graminis]WIH16206.1 type III pantothenate kinase [Xanthomonas translucens pv. graminis]
MSDWLFDLGNSRFKFAALERGRTGAVQAWPHGAEAMDAAAVAALPRGDSAYVASVAAPALTATVLDALHSCFAQVQVARTEAVCAGVRIAYAQPHKFGVDRFLALLAAHGDGDVLVVGVGTALTLDLLDRDGLHHGGRIAPSPTTMRQALQQRAAQLPAEGGDYREFAADTADALASGCDGAALALIERSLQRGEALLTRRPRLLLHGGGAPPLLHALPAAEQRPSLVLDGLALWAQAHAAAGRAG